MRNTKYMLSNAEQVGLVRKYQSTQDRAEQIAIIDRLYEANTGLLGMLAKKYQHISSLDYDDLFNSGALGIEEAVKRYDVSASTKFTSYLVFWIKERMLLAIKNTGYAIRLPSHMFEKRMKVAKAIRELEAATHAEPTIEDIAEHTALSIGTVRAILAHMQSVLSTDIAYDHDSASGIPLLLIDTIEDHNQLLPEGFINLDAKQDLYNNLLSAILKLSDKEQYIVKSYYGLNTERKTLQEIANELGLTRERIRQIRVQAELQLQQELRQYQHLYRELRRHDLVS